MSKTESRIERVEMQVAEKIYQGDRTVTITLGDRLSSWEQLAVHELQGYGLRVYDVRHLVWDPDTSEFNFGDVVRLIDTELSERALAIERVAHSARLDAREELLSVAEEHGFEVD